MPSRARCNQICDEPKYDEESPGLGDEFLDEVNYGLFLLAENPYLGAKLQGTARRFVLRRFPYSLIYRIHADHVLVLAVAHHRRRPGYWKGRK